MARRVVFLREVLRGHNFLSARPSDKNNILYRQPIVHIHGMAGFAGYLDKLMRYFAERGFVSLAPDIMGHGERSHEHDPWNSVNDYVEDVADFLDVIVRDRHAHSPVLVGHSMGGVISAKLSERSDVSHTIMITPAPPAGVLFLPGGMIRLGIEDVLTVFSMAIGGKRKALSKKFIESLFADPVRSKDVIDIWLKREIPSESLVAALELGGSMIRVDREKVGAKMLVVGAGRDVVIHPSVSKRVAKYFSADHIMLPELGHMCPFEFGWEDTARAILVWMKEKGVQ